MIFPQLKTEPTVQVGDKTRIDASGTFISPDQDDITKIEVRPTALADYIDVTSRMYLDWVYNVAGTYEITVRITTGTGLDEETATLAKDIVIVSAEDDRLFSNDNDLLAHEGDLYRWLREGRASYLDVHRLAQELILEDLAKRNITNIDGSRVTKDQVNDLREVREWSKFLTLSLIFKSVTNEVNDFFISKARDYAESARAAAERATVRLKKDTDSPVIANDLKSTRLVRR